MSEILLIDPKYAHNVGGVVRAAAVFGANAVWWTGDRIDLINGKGKERLPREERLRSYAHVQFGQVAERTIFDETVARGLIPVAVEIVPGAESLVQFRHPESALYVFGPEDGRLNKMHLRLCHRFVKIPSSSCVNLAAAVNITLYDHTAKALSRGS